MDNEQLHRMVHANLCCTNDAEESEKINDRTHFEH